CLSSAYASFIVKKFGPQRAAQRIGEVINDVSSQAVPSGACKPSTSVPSDRPWKKGRVGLTSIIEIEDEGPQISRFVCRQQRKQPARRVPYAFKLPGVRVEAFILWSHCACSVKRERRMRRDREAASKHDSIVDLI